MNLWNHLAQAPPYAPDPNGAEQFFSWRWLPPQHSTVADPVDWLFWFIMWVCVFFFVLIVALMLYFVFKYRRRDESEPIGRGATHNLPLELSWSVPPLVISLFMFYWGLEEYVAMSQPPANAYTIEVDAKKWNWNFRYANGTEHPELHCWKGQPVRLVMRSQDVLHAFFVPDFRVKTDVVPGRYSIGWFTPVPESVGRHRLYCTEYCGTDHWKMKTHAEVHDSREEFEKWLATAALRPVDKPRYEWGEVLYQRKGCNSCHNVKDEVEQGWQGPSWVNTADNLVNGKMRRFSDGTEVLADENYLEESMKFPQKRIVLGFETGRMPFTKLTDDDRMSIIAYIRALEPPKKKD